MLALPIRYNFILTLIRARILSLAAFCPPTLSLHKIFKHVQLSMSVAISALGPKLEGMLTLSMYNLLRV